MRDMRSRNRLAGDVSPPFTSANDFAALLHCELNGRLTPAARLQACFDRETTFHRYFLDARAAMAMLSRGAGFEGVLTWLVAVLPRDFAFGPSC